jgi:hypothetical protein
MKRMLKVALVLTLATAVSSTYAATQKSSEPNQQGSSSGSQPMTNTLSGKVIETMNSGGYTYIQIEKDNNKTWLAVPKSDIKVGQEISAYPGGAMPNFESKTLNRTFEAIIFSPGLIDNSSVKPEKDAHGSQGSLTPAKETVKKETFNKESVKVDKASGPDAYTVAELYDKRSTLDKKNVVVRGKVVKVSAGIMNKNWIHIQDGSGNATNGTNDIIVTTDDLPSVGDVVTMSGTLASNMDIGSGYKFDAIIEQASIKQ